MKTSSTIRFIIGTALAIASVNEVRAVPVYVNPLAGGTNDGTSWTNAYVSLENALTLETTAREFWVVSAVYVAPVGGFSIQSGDLLYGGFIGTETARGQRDWNTNLTVLTAEVGTSGHGDNRAVIIYMPTSSASTRIDGFQLSDADQHAVVCTSGAGGFLQNNLFKNNTNLDALGTGGALQIDDVSSPRVEDCKFQECSAHTGGAVFVSDDVSDPPFINCTFMTNIAVRGGAMAVENDAAPAVSNCLFQGNSVSSNSEDALGGALYVSLAPVSVVATQFIGNSATYDGTGSSLAAGAAIRSEIASETPGVDIRRCYFFRGFVGNANGSGGGEGGAISVSGPAIVAQCDFELNIVNVGATGFGGGTASGDEAHFQNCRYWDNTVDSFGFGCGAWVLGGRTEFVNCLMHHNFAMFGGGIACLYSTFDAVNCTIADNSSSDSGGGVYVDDLSGDANVSNCIVWQNCADSSCSTFADQIANAGDVAINYSDVQGCSSCGTGSIDADPQFVGTGNYRLQWCSPCIDAADAPDAIQDTFDLDNNGAAGCSGCPTGQRVPDLDLFERVVTIALVPQTGVAEVACRRCGSYLDMGAYERFLPGDLNGDDKVNGLDIQPFTHCYIAYAAVAVEGNCRHADMDDDGDLDLHDLECFIHALLFETPFACIDPCGSFLVGMTDCNDNDVPDANDIASGTSLDCNTNGIPDECDINVGDPDGNELVSNDVNSNDIPDECEPDCNSNGIPDAWDISQTTSNDVNSNDIPDECELDCNDNNTPDDYDISTSSSPDCNSNGVPDECEYDCNSNGVPDDCDVDPLDPDGDTLVSEDCNENGVPDECDLSRAILASFDCNGNNVPDECDIANSTSEDCNENGIPDECDIANSISEDANENDIPDECEEEFLMGGGGQNMMGGEFDVDAAWGDFYEWYEEQVSGTPGDWGTLTGPQRFERVIDELRILGLPLEAPW